MLTIPRLVEHSFTVDVPNARLLNWHTPGGFEMLVMSIATTPATEQKLPVANSLPLPPLWMVEECSREFGQIAVLGLPFADAPRKDNMVTRPSKVNTIKPYILEAKNSPAYWVLDNLWNILATVDQTLCSYSLMGEVCSLNTQAQPLIRTSRMIYIIEGEMTLIAGSLMTTVKRTLSPDVLRQPK